MSFRCPSCGVWSLTHEGEVETFEYVRSQYPRRISTMEVAEQFGLTLPGSNNRLRALMKAGFVDRVREPLEMGGKLYLYGAVRR